MGSTTVAQFKELLPASTATDKLPARSKNVIMKLQNHWEGNTLKNLKLFIQILGIPGNYLHLSTVSKNSIVVHWLCATDKVPELEEAITASAKGLYAEGVEQIFIGGRLVLEFTEPTQGIGIILLLIDVACHLKSFFLHYSHHVGPALPDPTTQQSTNKSHGAGK